MLFFDSLIIYLVFLLFPILLYLIFLAYTKITNKKESELLFDLCLLSSVYLIIKYYIYFPNKIFLLLVNVPLVIGIIRKRNLLNIVLSIIITFYYYKLFDFNIYFVFSEYLFYFLYFYFFNKKHKKDNSVTIINNFTFLKGIVLSYEIFYIVPDSNDIYFVIINLFVLLIIFYVICYLVVKLMEKAEKILSLNKVLNELQHEKELKNSLFKITHEIKNPIAVCKGYVDMFNKNDMNKCERYNEIIKNELNRTLTIMDDFMNYTKIKVNLDIIDINMLLNEVLESFSLIFKINNIDLINKVTDDEIYINGDYDRLKQVFINLIKNGIESFDGKKGKLEINTKENNKEIIISIIDNGCGMDEDILKNINEMFYTTKKNGTGIGLPLSNEIIKLHNGKLNFYSKKGKGTTVEIIFNKVDIN